VTTTTEEDKVANADFYVQTDAGMTWVGTLFEEGAPVYLDDADLFGPAENRSFDEAAYRRIVEEVLSDARADDESVSAAAGDSWPWEYADSAHTDYVYVYVKGAVQVFRRGEDEHGHPGQFLAAVHYPNGARKPTRFPAHEVTV
jgi:hypothetical protein